MSRFFGPTAVQESCAVIISFDHTMIVDHLKPARDRMERAEKYWRKNSYYLTLTMNGSGRLVFIEEGSGRPITPPAGIFLELIYLATRPSPNHSGTSPHPSFSGGAESSGRLLPNGFSGSPGQKLPLAALPQSLGEPRGP